MKRNIKIISILFLLLACVAVISSVSIALLLPDKMKATGDVLTRLRTLMNGSSLGIEPLTAYIIPSDDSHQVSCAISESCQIYLIRSIDFRVNISRPATLAEVSSQASMALRELPLLLKKKLCCGPMVVTINKQGNSSTPITGHS